MLFILNIFTGAILLAFFPASVLIFSLETRHDFGHFSCLLVGGSLHQVLKHGEISTSFLGWP